jgi:hypothetical protein
LHNNVKNSGPRCARAAATQRQLLAVTALLATLLTAVLTTLAALSSLLASLPWLPGLVLAALLLLTGLLLPAAALLRVARVLLLVATRFILAWIIRHGTFSSYFEGFRTFPGPPTQCRARPFVPFMIDRTSANRLKNKQNRQRAAAQFEGAAPQ